MNRQHASHNFVRLLHLAFVLCSLPFAAYAQPSAASAPPATEARPEAQLLKALLIEVRQLRLAVQHNSLSQHRSQILLERIGRQQDRIESLGADLEQLRDQIQELTNPERYETELREMEEAVKATTDPQTRVALMQAYEGLKRSLAQQRQADQQELQRQQERERKLDGQLRLEQSRLTEMQEQLEAVEREMDRQLAEVRQKK